MAPALRFPSGSCGIPPRGLTRPGSVRAMKALILCGGFAFGISWGVGFAALGIAHGYYHLLAGLFPR